MCIYNHSSWSQLAKFKACCLVIRKAEEQIGEKIYRKRKWISNYWRTGNRGVDEEVEPGGHTCVCRTSPCSVIVQHSPSEQEQPSELPLAAASTGRILDGEIRHCLSFHFLPRIFSSSCLFCPLHVYFVSQCHMIMIIKSGGDSSDDGRSLTPGVWMAG